MKRPCASRWQSLGAVAASKSARSGVLGYGLSERFLVEFIRTSDGDGNEQCRRTPGQERNGRGKLLHSNTGRLFLTDRFSANMSANERISATLCIWSLRKSMKNGTDKVDKR